MTGRIFAPNIVVARQGRNFVTTFENDHVVTSVLSWHGGEDLRSQLGRLLELPDSIRPVRT